jgi:hypothetical protein
MGSPLRGRKVTVGWAFLGRQNLDVVAFVVHRSVLATTYTWVQEKRENISEELLVNELCALVLSYLAAPER